MSREYDSYLEQHKSNVKKGFDWIKNNLPELIPSDTCLDLVHQIGFAHDDSKTDLLPYITKCKLKEIEGANR